MVRSVTLLLVFLPQFAVAVVCKDPTGGQGVVDRLNQRYDDFERYHRNREARLELLQKSAPDVKKAREEHKKRLEKARLEYVRVPKDKNREAILERAWEAEQKERQKLLEESRACYVHEQNVREQWLKRGRAIPGNMEYDLDPDY